MTLNEAIDKTLAGERLAISRLISAVENDTAEGRRALSLLYPHTGRAHIVGVTGAPGTGKSTLVNELAQEYRRRGVTVGIVAVDPTSPFTGGAILGDRIRMRDLSGDSGIFIRSMASRGHLGGLAGATADVVKILDAAGYEVIVVETVGAGQAEVEIAKTAHTTIVLDVPGLGDDIQAIKAGLLEIADILVVNKADREGADTTVATLQTMLDLDSGRPSISHHGEGMVAPTGAEIVAEDSVRWRPPIIKTIATTGEGIDAVLEAIEQHSAFLRSTGRLRIREQERARAELMRVLSDSLLGRCVDLWGGSHLRSLTDRIAARELDSYSAAETLLTEINIVRKA